MSKVLEDLDNLSPEDAIYASDRGLLSAEQEAAYGITPVDGGGAKGAEGASAYEEWEKDDLVNELESRGLATGGSVAQMRKRLDKSDAESAEES